MYPGPRVFFSKLPPDHSKGKSKILFAAETTNFMRKFLKENPSQRCTGHKTHPELLTLALKELVAQ